MRITGRAGGNGKWWWRSGEKASTKGWGGVRANEIEQAVGDLKVVGGIYAVVGMLMKVIVEPSGVVDVKGRGLGKKVQGMVCTFMQGLFTYKRARRLGIFDGWKVEHAVRDIGWERLRRGGNQMSSEKGGRNKMAFEANVTSAE